MRTLEQDRARERRAGDAIRFTVAAPDDNPALERLLEQPMEGAVRIALPRRNPAAESGVDGEHRTTVVARDPHSNAILGVGTRVVRRCWVDGKVARVGYLCNLRQDASLVQTSRRAAGIVLRRGFSELFRHRTADELPFDYTTILSDNRSARRFLERNARGLPHYELVGALSTLVFRTSRPRLTGTTRAVRGLEVHRAQPSDLPEIVDCLRRNLQRYDFAPAWTLEQLGDPILSRGLDARDFFVLRKGGQVLAVAALWDQSESKPIVVDGYDPSARRLRPLVNLLQGLRGAPRLPAPGSLSLAYVSHFSVDLDCEDLALPLIDRIRAEAMERGLELLALGLAANEPLLPSITPKVRPFVLGSRVYRVWPPGTPVLAASNRRPTAVRPEIAIL